MEKERLQFCIQRCDHYYESINNKSALFLAIGTFIFGGLIACYPYLKEHVHCGLMFNILLAATLLLAFSAIILLLLAAIPYLSKEKDSIYYFNSVASKGLSFLIEKSKVIAEDEDLADLRQQYYSLSAGIKKKFCLLKIAGIMYICMFSFLFLLMTFIIFNLK